MWSENPPNMSRVLNKGQSYIQVCNFEDILCYMSAVLDGLAEYQMLLMMAKLSTGWTLSSSFSTLDPKQMKQISVCVVTISVLQVCWMNNFKFLVTQPCELIFLASDVNTKLSWCVPSNYENVELRLSLQPRYTLTDCSLKAHFVCYNRSCYCFGELDYSKLWSKLS